MLASQLLVLCRVPWQDRPQERPGLCSPLLERGTTTMRGLEHLRTPWTLVEALDQHREAMPQPPNLRASCPPWLPPRGLRCVAGSTVATTRAPPKLAQRIDA